MNRQKHTHLWVGAIVLAAVAVVALAFAFRASAPTMAPVAETPESQPADTGWATSVDAATGVSFRYPPELATTYIRPVEWPPTLAVSNEAYACAPEEGMGREVREVRVDGSTYCVTESGEGAAGSIYTEYAYRTEKAGRLVTLQFTLRSTQCANYDEPELQACTSERESFDPDALAHQIAETVEFD